MSISDYTTPSLAATNNPISSLLHPIKEWWVSGGRGGDPFNVVKRELGEDISSATR